MPFLLTNTGGWVDSLSVPGGFSIMEDTGIEESANPEIGPVAKVKFKCTWDDHYSFIEQLIGSWTGTWPKNVVYIGPYRYPLANSLLCTAIDSVTMLGKPKIVTILGINWLVKQYAIVTAVFSRPPWQAASSGGYFSISFNATGEFLTLPETTYRFNDGTPTNTPIGIVIPQGEITVTRYRMPFIPDQIVSLLLGKVNNNPFQIGYNIYGAQTLLFAGINTDFQYDVFGNITYTVGYKFLWRPISWNYYFHPNRTTGFAIVTDGNGNAPYGLANFDIIP